MDLKQLRETAAAEFKTKGFPTTREELWRFTDVSALAKHDFSNEWKASTLPFKPLSNHYLVFENGKLSLEKSHIAGLPAGIVVGSILDHTDARLGSLADTQSAFVAANTAYFSDGAFIEIADGVNVESPIHLIYLSDHAGAASQVRNFVSAGVGSRVTVIEEYVGEPDSLYWMNAVTEVFVADEASVDHYKIQLESAAAFHFQTLAATLGAKATFSNHSVALGAKLGRNDLRVKLTGEGGEATCNGLYLLKDRQHFDTHIFMDHAAAKCNSHELYKGILDEKSRAVFCGRILVQQDAQQTDAVQSNKNLLLSRGAKVNTLPQLEIYADDVKCTHGATIGELDEQALYYLQTRGIDPVRGKAMLTYAFAREALCEIQCNVIKNDLEQRVQDWLERISA